MKSVLIFCTLLFFSSSLWGQTIKRVEVKGELLSATNDIEGVTVFNTSTNIGTISNDKGEFSLVVAEHDIIEISALQFQTVTLEIDVAVITTKMLKIQLVEQINQLDAVILSSGLSGNLNEDINNVKVVKLKRIEVDMDMPYEYSDDKAFDKSVVTADLNKRVNKGGFYNGVDVAKILNLNKLFKRKSAVNNFPDVNREKELLDLYSQKSISETFNIPLDEVGLFVSFVEVIGIDKELLMEENEIHLIGFLLKQSTAYLNQQKVKHK